MKHVKTYESFINEADVVHTTFQTDNFIQQIKDSAFANRNDFKRFIQAVLSKADKWTSIHKFRLNKGSLAWLGEIYAKENGKDVKDIQADIDNNMETYKKLKVYR